MSVEGTLSGAQSLEGGVSSAGNVQGTISGLKMIKGYSAYEVAVINGFRGTEKEWLDDVFARLKKISLMG